MEIEQEITPNSSTNTVETWAKRFKPRGHIQVFDMSNGKLLKQDDNLVTAQGLHLILQMIGEGKSFGLEYGQLWISDNLTAPAESDKTAQFCLMGTDKFFPAQLNKPYIAASTLVFTATLFKPNANFTWQKLGLVDKHGRLICEDAFVYAGKTSAIAVEVKWGISLGNA